MDKTKLADGIRMVRVAEPEFKDYTQTFLFDSEEALHFAMAVLYNGGIAYATAISPDDIHILQVKGERLERRARKLFHKHFYLTHFENLSAYDADGNESLINAHYCALLHPISKALYNNRLSSIRNVLPVGA